MSEYRKIQLTQFKFGHFEYTNNTNNYHFSLNLSMILNNILKYDSQDEFIGNDLYMISSDIGKITCVVTKFNTINDSLESIRKYLIIDEMKINLKCYKFSISQTGAITMHFCIEPSKIMLEKWKIIIKCVDKESYDEQQLVK